MADITKMVIQSLPDSITKSWNADVNYQFAVCTVHKTSQRNLPPWKQPKKCVALLQKKGKLISFPQHFSLLTTTIILIQTKETKQKK